MPFRSLTLEEAKSLRSGVEVCHRTQKQGGRKPVPQRWRVNGKPKTWKRDPSRVEVPLKHGLYSYGYLTEGNLSDFGFCPPSGGWDGLGRWR